MRASIAAALAFMFIGSAQGAAPGPLEMKPVEVVGLRSVAGWLRQYGVEGYVGADVADAMGIPRAEDQDALEAKQRGFRTDETLRMAQAFDQYLLFMVQQPGGEVFLYLSTVRDGLRKALVSIPSRNLVTPLERLEAENNFRAELLYWKDKAATE